MEKIKEKFKNYNDDKYSVEEVKKSHTVNLKLKPKHLGHEAV